MSANPLEQAETELALLREVASASQGYLQRSHRLHRDHDSYGHYRSDVRLGVALVEWEQFTQKTNQGEST